MASQSSVDDDETPLRLTSYNARAYLSSSLDWLRSFYPKLIPLLVCLGALPILMLFSLAAGWVVWRNMPEGWKVPIYLQYGEGIPYSNVEIKSISNGQPYDISLHLSVPASETNFALGNFMVSLDLRTNSNATLLNVRKPALIIPSSSILNIFGSPKLLDVIVPLASSVSIRSSRVNAHLTVGRADSWKNLGRGEGRELTVHQAYIHGMVKPEGLQRLISAFPMSSSIAAALTFFSISVLVLSICLLQASSQQTISDISETESVKKEEEEDRQIESETDESQKPLTATLRRRRSKSQGQSSAIYPTPEPDSQRRIKRRSSTLMSEDPQ